MIQKFIEGTEASLTMLVMDGKCLYSCRSLLETKKFMAGNLGQTVGCSSSILWGWPQKAPSLFMKTLNRVKDKWEGITGEIDINFIISDKNGEPYCLEFCPGRLGYSDIYATMQILPFEVGKYFSDMAEGKMKPFAYKRGFGGALKITVPPYPFEKYFPTSSAIS